MAVTINRTTANVIDATSPTAGDGTIAGRTWYLLLCDAIDAVAAALLPLAAARCKLTNTTDTSGVTSEATLAWDTEEHDTGGCHEGVTHPQRITVPSGADGPWTVGAQVRFTSGSAATLRHAYVRKNGTTYIGEAVVLQSTGNFACTVNVVAYDPAAVAGDYYELRVASGTSVDITGGTGQNTSCFWGHQG